MTTQPLRSLAPWLWAQTWSEVWAAGLDPPGAGRRQRDARLAQLLEAAAGSPFYRQRLTAAGRTPPCLQDIAPVDKTELMQHFDDWATDRRITRASVDRFLADPAHLGQAYLGEYMVWTSSGTSGHPGIFVQDARSLAVYDALDALRLRGPRPLSPLLPPLAGWGGGLRCAFVAATGGHFAGAASIERLRRGLAQTVPDWLQWMAPVIRTFSVQEPLKVLAEQLQAFAPTLLITYPSCAAALAQAQAEGGLKLALSEVWVGGEQLSALQRAQIGATFGCALRNNYGASEFFSMACECAQGRLHLNSDWLVLEPVDERMRPMPEGEASHSVLLTNLANHVQPLIRYRLGDSVRFIAGTCSCGNRLPIIEVQGRADDTLVLRDAHGRHVTLLPLALMTVIEEGARLTQFQLLCTGPSTLELRLEAEVPDPAAAFNRASAALRPFLAQQGLANVRVDRGLARPLHNAASGKLCRVIHASRPHR